MIAQFPFFTQLSSSLIKPLKEYLLRYPLTTENSLSMILAYHKLHHYSFSLLYGNLLIRHCSSNGIVHVSLFGSSEMVESVCCISEFLERQREPFNLTVYPSSCLEEALSDSSHALSQLFSPSGRSFIFNIAEERSDYLYSVQELVSLEGRGMKGFRQLVGRFSREYPLAQIKFLNPSDPNIQKEILSFTQQWLNEEGKDEELTFLEELIALEKIFEWSTALDLLLLGVYINDELIGYSLQDIVTADMAMGCFGKAIKKYKGVYQFIEWKAAQKLSEMGIRYLNNQEDVGAVNLRLAKQKMNPLGKVLAYLVSTERAETVLSEYAKSA